MKIRFMRPLFGLTVLAALTCVSAVPGPSAVGDDGLSTHAKVHKCLGHEATIVGTNGDDVIDAKSTGHRDVIVARRGSDTIYAYGGKDLICSGKGNDYVYGMPGRDRMLGSGGTDHMYGGGGNDRVRAGKGRDALYGEDGDRDYLNGGRGRDRTDAAGSGHDRCVNIERVSYPTRTCHRAR